MFTNSNILQLSHFSKKDFIPHIFLESGTQFLLFVKYKQ